MKRQFFILLVGLCISAVVFNSCDKKEISEDPTIEKYTHTINSNNSNPEGTNIKAYKNGQTIKTTNITNNSYKIEFTTNKPTETIDSITATKEGYKKFKITNTTIGTTTKKIDIQLKKIEEDTTKIFWFYANNSTPTGAQIKVFDNGQIHDETTTNNKYKTTNIKLPTDNEIDSVTVTAQGYNKQTFKKINVKEGANKLEFTLTQTQQPTITLTVNATNEETGQALNNAMIITDNLKGKLDTTYTNNATTNMNIEPGTLYVLKIAKNNHTGWVQEINNQQDITINKALMKDEEYETRTGAKVQLIQIFNNAWRNALKVTRKPDYNKKWTHNFKTTDDDNTTQLPQKFFDNLYENLERIETQIENTPILTTEQKNTLKNFITQMDTKHIETIPSNWKTQKNTLWSLYTMNLPGMGGISFGQDEDWNIINSMIRLRKTIVDDDYQMPRVIGQEYLSFIFGATDPSIYTTPQNSILDENTSLTAPSELDFKLFKHAMNTPAGTSYKDGVEIANISTTAAQSILVPNQYNR